MIPGTLAYRSKGRFWAWTDVLPVRTANTPSENALSRSGVALARGTVIPSTDHYLCKTLPELQQDDKWSKPKKQTELSGDCPTQRVVASHVGQNRRFARVPITSGLPR